MVPIQGRAAIRRVRESHVFNAAYPDDALNISHERIVLAGYRLADKLNDLLRP